MTPVLNYVARIALLVLLLAGAAWTILKPTLDEEVKRRDEPLTDVVTKGPLVVDDIEWTLDSLRVYTRLVDKDRKQIEVDVPAGAVLVVAELSVRPLPGLRMDDGFTCDVELRDDQGNIWKDKGMVFGVALPTYCGDDDQPIKRGETGRVMKIFVVPAKAVPRLLGVVTPVTGQSYRDKRVLIRS